MSLKDYHHKRNFSKTPEPKGHLPKKSGAIFIIQKHAASHLHYDFRLELDGVLKSWAVPKGPSYNPHQKRLAVEVEDHPIEYASFEGSIPQGQYGGGTVMLWDQGSWVPENDPVEGYKKGLLKFELQGQKLKGHWSLVRFKQDPGKKPNWLLIKSHDDYENSISDLALVDSPSVKTGRTMDEIEAEN
ncbi:MAG: DNA polymerase ligase N-terminal domain-containing protein [Gammaproteobacteria bacterium]|nr:DNA polymerase ligase N-terminal domain-containing protein [Gammaproteobacteria bacterium]